MDSSRADEVLRRIEERAEKRYLPIIGPDRGRIFVDLIHRFKHMDIEVGTTRATVL